MSVHAVSYSIRLNKYGRSLLHRFKLAVVGVNGNHAESAHVELDLEDTLHVADLLDLGHIPTGGVGWNTTYLLALACIAQIRQTQRT